MYTENIQSNLSSFFEKVDNKHVTEESADEKVEIKNKEDKNSHFVPIKLTAKEAVKALRCQKVMLDYARVQYKKSIGTKKEDVMRKMYNDAIVDYQAFIAQYEKELG